MSLPLYTAVERLLSIADPESPRNAKEAEALDALKEAFEAQKVEGNIKDVRGPGCSTDEEESHEAFGMVSFSRVSSAGRRAFFGSHIDNHSNFILMTVNRGVRSYSRDMSHARFRAAHRSNPIVEIKLTPAQFAGALTTMNMGDGVPCTIDSIDGRDMEEIPLTHKTEQQKIRAGFAQKMKDIADGVSPQLEAIEALLSKKSIGKADRAEIRTQLDLMRRQFSDSAPFALKEFTRSAEKVVTEAKADMEATLAAMVEGLGREALTAQPAEKVKKALKG